MQWILAGLGNPGDDYIGTRHNVGREFLMKLEKKILEFPNVKPKPKIILPDTYINNSGKVFKKLVTTKKAAEYLVVLHDDLDLPLGMIKLSFGSGAGGHRGVESIQETLKTKDFVRIRIGISRATPTGKLRKPDRDKVVDFVLGTFRPAEEEKLKKAQKTVLRAIELLLIKGRVVATMETHTR